MPRLRILAGPSPSSAVPIPVNDGVAHEIKGSQFEGHVSVYMRYEDEVVRTRRSGSVSSRSSRSSRSSGSSTESVAEGPASAYFGHPDRAGVTWSIQIQGRFITPVSADDVLFGNTFERPLKLPWGSSAALRFMNFIDPTLEHDLGGPKPWALSPLVSTMPYLAHSRLDKAPGRDDSSFPPERPLIDFCGSLIPNETSKSRSPSPLTSSSRGSSPGAEPESPAGPKRRNIFRSPAARRAVTLGPNDLLTADFCYGFLSFPSLTLKLPGGIRFDCMKYWDQQPVTFMCCQRGADGSGPGEPFWCVIFEVAEDEDDAAPADSPAGTGDRVDEVDSE